MRPTELLTAANDSANKAILATAQNMRAWLHKDISAVRWIKPVDWKQRGRQRVLPPDWHDEVDQFLYQKADTRHRSDVVHAVAKRL